MTDDGLQRILALDFSTYMPGSVLAKVDRASMAHGLEVRPPLLDDTLVDWAFSLPSRYKVRRTRGKHLLKLAARGKIPDEIIDRPKKGFGIPLASWLRGPLRPRIEEVVARSPVWGTGLLGREVFEPGTASIRRGAATPASPSGRCWCWIIGSAAITVLPHMAETDARTDRQGIARSVRVRVGRTTRRSCPSPRASSNAGWARRRSRASAASG